MGILLLDVEQSVVILHEIKHRFGVSLLSIDGVAGCFRNRKGVLFHLDGELLDHLVFVQRPHREQHRLLLLGPLVLDQAVTPFVATQSALEMD